jgi:hypothetical protein
MKATEARVKYFERRASEELCASCRSRSKSRELTTKEILETLAEIQADRLLNESVEELLARAAQSDEWAAWYRSLAASRA